MTVSRSTKRDLGRRVRLASGGWLSLHVTRVDIANSSPEDLMFIARVVDTIRNYEQVQRDRERLDDESRVALSRWMDDGGRGL